MKPRLARGLVCGWAVFAVFVALLLGGVIDYGSGI